MLNGPYKQKNQTKSDIFRQKQTFSDNFRQKQTFSDKKNIQFQTPNFRKENACMLQTQDLNLLTTLCLVREQQRNDTREQQNTTTKVRIINQQLRRTAYRIYRIGRYFLRHGTSTIINYKSIK